MTQLVLALKGTPGISQLNSSYWLGVLFAYCLLKGSNAREC